ncbi:MAG: PKD domain-containing protein [Bacteroidota bacterium]
MQDTVTRTIGVRSAPTADLLPVSDPFCRNVNLVLLEDSLEVAPGGGTTVFSGSGIVNPSGQFSPLLADTGRHVITATYTALNGCTAVDSMALVVTAPAPGQVFLPQTSFCFSDSAVALGGTPSSGTFSGLGVVGTDFQPDFAGPGLHILTYNYTDANGCAGTVQQAVQVFPNPPVSFSGLALQYCEDAPATSLFGTPQGGTFSGPGVNPLGNGFVFAAGDAGPGLHSVAYEFTDQNGCLGSSSQSVLVDTLPVVSFAGLDSTYCFGGASTELTGTPPGGLFTGSGIYSGNRFRADFAGPGPHPIAYTFTDGNSCSDLSQAMTEVFALPPVGLSSPAITLFQDSDPDALNYLVGTPPGGIFSGPGLTQNADTADFSPMVAQGGNHFLTYSVADSGTGCSDTARVRVTVIPAGTEAISGLDRDYCVSAGGSSLLAVFPPSNVPGFFRGPGVDSTGVFRPDLAGVGLHLIRFIRPSIPDTLRRLTRVHPDPQVTFAPTDRDYCPGEPVTNLFGQAAPLGGTFSGNGVQGTGFDPDLAGVGPDTIVYTYGVTYGSVTCRAEARAVFTVHALPEDSLLTAGPYCPNDPPVRLAGFNGYPTVDFGVAGQPDSLFRPMVLGPGDWGVEYTFQDSNGCTGADARVVTVSPEAQASILNLAPRYCQNADPVVLVGSEAVGYFYGPGVDSVTRTFSPGTLPVDTHTVAYVFTDANACTDTLFQTVIVDSLPTVTLSSPVDSLCQDAAALTLTGAPVLGLFSGEGIVNAAGGIFVPDSAAVGTHPITYTFTDSRGCAGRDTVEIFVKRVPTLSLSGLADTLCRGDSVLALGALPPGGMFLGAGIVDSVDGIFNPDSADLGLNAVGYAVDSAGCSAEIAVTTVVNPLPVATFFGLALEYCADAAADSLFGVRSGTFSGVGVTDGPGLNGVFAPVVADTGDHQVVHAVTELGCTAIASVAVRVHPLPVVSFTGLAAQYCQDGNNEAYTLTGSPADTARGVFSGMGVLGNLVFDPDTVPGNANYAISYTYTDSNQCANVATQMVRVDSMPVVTFSLPQDTLCASDSAVVLNGSPAVGGTGLFTGATNLTNTLFEPAVVGPGNYVLGYAFTDSNGCSDQDADSVFIPSVPAVNLSLPQYVFCEDDAAVAVTVGPAPGTLTGNGIANGDYFPNLAGPGTDTVRYVHPYGPGCEVVAVRTVTVNARPQPAIIALPAAICWNGGRVALNGVPSGGTFSGPGVDSFNNEFDPQVADSAGQGGNFAITYTFTDANGCTAFTQETIRVDPLPGLSVAGNYSNFAYCSNEARDSLLGSPAGGSFFGAGITANGVFDPAQVPGAGPDTTVTATIAYTYTDSLGCTDTLPVPVTVNALPNLMLNGLAAEYCLNADPDTLFGGPAGGDFIGMGMTMGDSVFKPDSVGQWTIGYAYTDPSTGCRDTVTEATEVYPLPQAFFSGLDSTYCINGDSAVLSGSPGDSTWFTGNGIGGNGATYFPEIAGTGGDTVVYFVQDANDCVDSLAQATVVHDTVPVNITVPPGPRVCFNEGATQLAVVPPGGTWSGVGIVDSTGVLFPGQLDTLSYRGMYQFTSANGCTSIDTADYVGIAPPSLTLNNLAGQYCENNAPDTLVISPAWDALLVNGTALPNAVFVPDSGLRGPVGVEIFYQDPATGCRDTLRDSTRVYPAPSVDFGYAGTCVGDTTFFTDSTALDAIGSLPPDGLAFWTWNFGTGNSVANQDPSFLFASADTHTVALTVVTAQGCRDSAQQVVDIGANPVAEFTWRYVCEGNRTEFLNASTADLNDTIVTYAWSLGDGTTNNSAAPQHIYPSVGRYSVRLVLATESECVDTLVREVAIRPVIDQFPYVEDFENGPGGWLPENPERNVNWEFGTPAGLVLTGAASGDSAWATQLAGNYPNSDTATLGGPCFDLGALLRPMIRLNVNYELEAGRDGVVLQVSTDGGLVWENLGEVNSGLNWFDDFGIRGEPGNEIFNPDAEGWTGASGGWRQARHKLDRYRTAGDSLRFRIAFGSNGTNVREGFAVDDLRIEERNRTVLLENFTSAVDPASVTFDQSLNQLVAANPGNVVAVYYHLGENDPFFAANNDGEALLEHYQKQSSPYAVMDGNWYAGGTGRWLAAADTNQLALDKRLLTTAPFAIQNLSRTVTGNSVAAAADFVYGGDSTWTDSLRFFLVVVEREITGLTGIPNGNGQMDFPWVMKALLPDGPEGRRLDTTWTPGAAAYSVSGTWNLGPGQSIYDTSQVGVVAFVRRIADKEILQAAYLGLNPDPITDAEEAQAGGREELLVFPNPAAELVNVVAPGRRLDAVRLVDLPGRILWEGRPRTSRAQIDVRGLAEGVYFVQVTVKGQVETRKVVVRR